MSSSTVSKGKNVFNTLAAAILVKKNARMIIQQDAISTIPEIPSLPTPESCPRPFSGGIYERIYTLCVRGIYRSLFCVDVVIHCSLLRTCRVRVEDKERSCLYSLDLPSLLCQGGGGRGSDKVNYCWVGTLHFLKVLFLEVCTL